MFKKLALLLISLLAIPAAINCSVNNFNNASMVMAEGDDPDDPDDPEDPVDLGPSPYTFTEDDETGYMYITRYYEPCDLVPKVNKTFCAPKGYAFVLSYSDEQVDALLEEMDRCKADYNYRMFDCVFYYTIMDTTVYSDSDPEGIENRDQARDFILNAINGFKLFEVREINEPLDLSFTFEFQFCIDDPDLPDFSEYHFIFTDDTIRVEPYNEYDFVSLSVWYYIRDGEHRFNVSADLIDGFFYEEPSYNESGFHTDTTHDDYWGRTYADYIIDIYANDAVVIGSLTNASNYGIEMYYNDSDMALKARLTFVSNGVHYEYWSQVLMVGNPKLHTVIDGYYDRDFIQRDQDHAFTLDINRNVFDPESGYFGGSFTVEAWPTGLCDPDYGHVYASRNAFPAVGQVGHYYYDLDLTDEEAASFNPNDKSIVATNWYNLYVWNEKDQEYDNYYGETVIDIHTDPYIYNPENPDYDPSLDINDIFTNVTSLPFVGEWTFRYHAYFGGYNYSVGLEEGYGQTVQVVSTGETDNKVSLNVPDNVNLVVGGDTLEIVPALSSKDDSLVYYYECELSKGGVVDAVKTEAGDKFIITPLAAGSLELTITAESRLFDKISKTITINVVESETVYNVAKIEAPTGFATAGEDLVCALNVKGLKNFQNMDIDWDVTDREGDPVPENKLVDNKNASITILNAEIGDYTISASYEGVELDTIVRQVRYKVADVVDPTDDVILLNAPDNINLLAGGDAFDIVPTVSSYNESTEYYYDYELSKDNVVSITKGDNGKLTISPINSGTVSLKITVNYEPNHVLTKTVSIRVLDAIYDVSSIEVPDEFHYAGKDLTAAINIRGFTSFQNLDIEWTVLNKKGEALPEEQVINNGDATITIVAPDSDDYTVSASYNGVQLDSIVVQVRYVDMNKFLRINIWWIFLITMSFVALLVFLKIVTKRSKTTVENIERVYQVFCQCLSDDKLTKEELIQIKKEITKCLRRCEDLNIDALNQYEKATRYLRKSLIDTKALINNFDTTSPADRGVYTERLDNDLAKALNVAKEIENAKGLIEDYHAKANRQNYEQLKDDSQNKKINKQI